MSDTQIDKMGQHNIILIDDDEAVLDLVKEYLEMMGATGITLCQKSHKALELIKARKFDLIICDWQMPEMDGGALFQKVKSLPKYQKTPYIIFSGHLTKQDLMLLVEFGASHYLLKPVSFEDLYNKLKEIPGIGHPYSDYEKKTDQIQSLLYERKLRGLGPKINTLIKKYPDKIFPLELLAEYHTLKEDWEQVKNCVDKILTKKPHSLGALNKLAQLKLKQKDFKGAIQSFEKLNSLSPKNVVRLIELGDLYLNQNQAEKAEEVFKDAQKLEPQNDKVADGMGKSLIMQGKFEESVTYLNNTKKAENMARYCNNLGIVLVQQSRFEEARNLYQTAIRSLPCNSKDSQLFFNLGLSYKKESQWEKAAVYFKKALDLNSNFGKSILNLKEIYQKVESLEDYEVWLSKIAPCKLDPKN